MRRRLKAFEDGPAPAREKFWPRFLDVSDSVFGLSVDSAGMEGWFTAKELRALAALLDEYMAEPYEDRDAHGVG